jgi:hypothetical protein
MGLFSRVLSSWFEPNYYMVTCIVEGNQRTAIVGLFGQKKYQQRLNAIQHGYKQLVAFLPMIDASAENIRELHADPDVLVRGLKNTFTFTQKPEIHIINLDEGKGIPSFITIVDRICR